MCAIVEERLRELGILDAPTYTSVALPPGITSREHFAAECRRLHIGERNGKVWTVDAAAWREARAKRDTKLANLRVVSDEERADSYLEAAGLRRTRGTR